jgi:uncharacterized protein YndB with AHSA1/START domain
MNYTKLNINANIALAKEIVWDLYTNPLHIVNWNFASDDWCCPRATNDLKVRGKYVGRMEAKDGSFGFDFEAVYNEVAEGEYFVYTTPDNRVIKVSFQIMGNNTLVNIEFDAENENSLELQQNGWQAILNNFKKYAESI